jgi:phosphopantothenoylcysteine decarboxylase/phosphopantothenate--cysteine ligase
LADSGFESDTNSVTLFFRDGSREVLPVMEKMDVAHILLDRIRDKLPGGTATQQSVKK